MRSNAKISFAIAAVASFFAFAGQAFAAPTVTIDPGPTVSYTTISVSGTVDPGDQDVGVYAEYAIDPGGPWGEKLIRQIAANAGPTPVSYEITGLAAGTQYYVRLNAWTGAYNVSDVVTATTLQADPPSVTIDPVTAVTGEGAHFSGEVDTATGTDPVDANWHFECVPECPGLTGGVVSAGDSATVEADATGLLLGTFYEVSLVANGNGGQQIAGPESFTTLTAPPRIGEIDVKRLPWEAVAQVAVNPGGAETTYYFEYGETPAYGRSTAPKTLPAGATAVRILDKLTGLRPATTYHVRLVASNANGPVQSSDTTFATLPVEAAGNCSNEAVRSQQGATNLPECRAYELVSPVDKAFGTVAWKPSGSVGGEIPTQAAEWGVTAASPEGDTVTYPSWAAFPGNDVGIIQNYRSRRGPSGWTTKSGSPPLTVPDPNAVFCPCYPFWKGASADLNTGLMITSNSWSPDDHNAVGRGEIFNLEPLDAYVRRADESTDLVSIGTSGNAVGNVNQESGTRYNLSLDGSAVVFQTANEVVSADASRVPGVEDIYLNRDGKTQLVQLRPDGTKVSECGSGLALPGNPLEFSEVAITTDRSISTDGGSVVFTAPAPGYFGTGPECEVPPRLYVKASEGEILDVAESQRPTPDPAGTKRPQFVSAAADGSRIFFTSAEMLTADTPERGEATRYLYEYSVADRELRFLLVTHEGTESVTSVMAVSRDAERIYFSSRFDFAEGWQSGQRNIYVLHDGEIEWIGAGASLFDNGDGNSTVSYLLSPDGRSLLFAARSELNGNFTNDQDQVYLHRESRPLVCVSCQVGGPPPTSDARISLGIFPGAWNEPGRFSSSLSDDGSKVVFETGESLLPGDRDGGKRDVYLWNEEVLSLLTPSHPERNHRLLGMSGDGRDVFVGTYAALLAEDTDGGDQDIYDIRVGGGFPHAEATAGTGCSGEACQAPAASPPGSQRQASALIQASGNVKKARAKKKKPKCAPAKTTKKSGKNRAGKRVQGKCKTRGASGSKGGAK